MEKGAFGIVFRNNDADLRGIGHFFMEIGWEVEVMEAGAIRWGIKVAFEVGISKVLIKSNSLNVVRALQQKHISWNSTGTILRDCLYLVNLFESFSFCWVRCNCNKVVHHMAKVVIESSEERVWVESFSESIQSMVVLDKSSLVE